MREPKPQSLKGTNPGYTAKFDPCAAFLSVPTAKEKEKGGVDMLLFCKTQAALLWSGGSETRSFHKHPELLMSVLASACHQAPLPVTYPAREA